MKGPGPFKTAVSPVASNAALSIVNSCTILPSSEPAAIDSPIPFASVP